MRIERITNKKYASQIANIHIKTFKGFFLTFLGEGFLTELYKGFMTHEYSGVLGAFEDVDSISSNNNSHNIKSSLVGFLAYSENISQFYKYLIRKRLIPFAWYSLLAFCRKPKVMFRLLRALTYSKVSIRDDKYIELASIGVDPNFKNKGIGSLLIIALKKQVKEKERKQKYQRIDSFAVAGNSKAQFKYIKIETDKINNDSVNAFYLKNGFVLDSSYTTNEGRKMNEYRYYL